MIIRGIVPNDVHFHITLKNLSFLDSLKFHLVGIREIFSISETHFNENPHEVKRVFEKVKGKVLYVVPSDPEYIFIFSSRTKQIEKLYDMLISLNIKTDTLYDKKINYDPKAQILIVGEKKGGVGFNDPKFKTSFYASDISIIEQVFGRLRRDDGIHYDFVDDHYSCEKHFEKRLKFYKRVRSKVVNIETGHTL